jgi:hypothetical protein
MSRALVMFLVRQTPGGRQQPITPWKSDIRPMRRLAKRYAPFLPDEIQCGDDSIYKRLPWWAPFNILMHHWLAHDDGAELHDHPRWSVTICLKGELVEKTPWGERTLRPGSIVFRRSNYIHGFRVAPAHSARTWTLFIVGRRRAPQNTYVITRRTEAAQRRAA